MKWNSKRTWLFLIVFVVVYLFIFCAAFGSWHDYERLAHAGVQTTGRVVATEPDSHNSVRYEYSVASNSYSGASSANFGRLPPLSSIAVGDPISVTYRPDDLSVSVPGNPDELYHSWSFLLFGVAPVAGLLTASANVWRVAKRRGRNGVAPSI